MNNFVVRQRQVEVFRKRVDQTECQLIVVVLAMDRIFAHVTQRIVHPTHVPLEREPEPARFCGAAYARPCGRFFSDRQHPRVLGMRLDIEFTKQMNGIDVLASAILIRDPFPLFAGVIEIQHRSNRIHSQSIDVVLVEPEQCVGNQEVLDFVTAKIEDHGAPVWMLTLARVGVLIKR